MTETASLIVGASRGLGRSLALALAEAGERRVVGTYHLDREAIDTTAKMAGDFGCDLRALQVDLADHASIAELRRSVDALGWRIQRIVHSGSTGNWLPLGQARARTLRRVIDVMGLGMITLSAAFRDHLAETHGSVLGVSSLGSMRAVPFYGPIALAKAALEASTRYLARELQPDGIRVNCLRPGIYESASMRASPMSDEMLRIFNQNALRVPLKTSDIADVALWLMGESSGSMTGQVVNIDGGFSVGPGPV